MNFPVSSFQFPVINNVHSYLFSFLLAGITALSVSAQTASIDPKQLRWGEPLTVSYDTVAGRAKLSPGHDIYVVVRLGFPGETRTRSYRMVREGNIFKSVIEIPVNLAAIELHFIALDGGWDQAAFISSTVLRTDGKPARGAYQSRIHTGKYKDYFKLETDLYPDNYSAYRSKWMAAQDIEGETAAGMIESELLKLSGRKVDSPELLSTLAYGNSLFGREEKSLGLIRELVRRYPSSPFTAQAISDYERLLDPDMAQIRRSEIAELKVSIVRQVPGLYHSRHIVSEMAADQRLPLELTEQAVEQWIKEEADNPQPYFNLAQAYRAHHQKYDRALELIDKAIELLIAGRLRLYGDISGNLNQRLLGESYPAKSDLLFRSSQYDSAITIIKVAQTFDIEPSYTTHLLEARIWWAAGKRDAAEAAFLEAWRRGSKEALDRLKTGYREKTGNETGFDNYLSELNSKQPNNGDHEVKKRPLPDFRAKTLNGETVDLNALQGKIVVINLWFIACGPCRKEIPGLNQLVNEFSNGNVIFLAPTPDSAVSLRDFLKHTEFKYRIIPEAENLINAVFNTETFPSHILINTEGQIEARFIGGGNDRPAEIRRELTRMLK